MIIFIIFVIAIAFLFDFINGFHDASNAIATIVATKVLTARQAVLWAAFFNFIAFMIFNLSVAKMIGSGLINSAIIDPYFIFSTLMGAIIWNLVTWYFGLPSSSSHALIGGIAGAALMKGGTSAIIPTGFIKVIAAIFISPIVGLLVGLLVMSLLNKVTQFCNEKTAQLSFKIFQLFSSAMLSLSHGGNDAQKTMGIITILLYSAGWIEDQMIIPFWVIISCNLVIALGTLFGGWRIVDTLAHKITDINPERGSSAETGAAITIFYATHLGIPVSTTHTVTGAIVGAGISQDIRHVKWRLLVKIFWTWLFTIPAAASVASIFMILRPSL